MNTEDQLKCVIEFLKLFSPVSLALWLQNCILSLDDKIEADQKELIDFFLGASTEESYTFILLLIELENETEGGGL